MRMIRPSGLFIFALVVSCVAFTFAGCGETRGTTAKGVSGEEGNSSNEGSSNGGEEETGEEEATGILLAVGAEHVFELEANPTTGFQWVVQELDQTILKLVSQIYEASPGGATGSGGIDRFTFEGMGAGSVRVTIHYMQPWDSEVPPAEVHELAITVAN